MGLQRRRRRGRAACRRLWVVSVEQRVMVPILLQRIRMEVFYRHWRMLARRDGARGNGSEILNRDPM